MFLIFALLVGFVFAEGGHPTEPQCPKMIYDNYLHHPFEDWSWGEYGSVDMMEMEKVYTAPYSICFKPKDWNGFYLSCPSPHNCISLGTYDGIYLWIHGGYRGGQMIEVWLEKDGSTAIGHINIEEFIGGPIPGGEWTRVFVDFSKFMDMFGLTTSDAIGGFYFQAWKAGMQYNIYFDEITLHCRDEPS